jgi:hypothetical protein
MPWSLSLAQLRCDVEAFPEGSPRINGVAPLNSKLVSFFSVVIECAPPKIPSELGFSSHSLDNLTEELRSHA